MTLRFLAAISVILMTGCGGFSVSEPPATSSFELTSSGRIPTEAIAAARASIGLAAATGALNARLFYVGDEEPQVRSLQREVAVGGPEQPIERHLVRVEAAPSLPERTLVTAGPPVANAAAHRPRNADRFAMPIEDPRITSRFGPRIDPITGARGRMHRGTDFGAPTGTPILATASGTVVLGGWCDGGTGNCVVIDHAGGWRSQYFHLSRVSVSPGDEVVQGDVIGEVGSTGRSTGPHLHFQIGQRGGDAVDPETLIGEPLE